MALGLGWAFWLGISPFYLLFLCPGSSWACLGGLKGYIIALFMTGTVHGLLNQMAFRRYLPAQMAWGFIGLFWFRKACMCTRRFYSLVQNARSKMMNTLIFEKISSSFHIKIALVLPWAGYVLCIFKISRRRGRLRIHYIF